MKLKKGTIELISRVIELNKEFWGSDYADADEDQYNLLNETRVFEERLLNKESDELGYLVSEIIEAQYFAKLPYSSTKTIVEVLKQLGFSFEEE